ncbi:MAG: TetR/AcrR family transcriptional regulator [Bacteroidales bacterium]|nr:TetR/AcrR family transcriptional regulator [Bacteroidales bacterium]
MDLKERIIQTALVLFGKYGIKSITMDEIACGLGISKRTLYETFKDKESILMECYLYKKKLRNDYALEVMKESENVLDVILKVQKKQLEDLLNVNQRFFDDLFKYYPRVEQMIKEDQVEHQKEARAFFEKGVGQGIFRNDLDFDIISMLITEQINWLMHSKLKEQFPFVKVFRSILYTYMRGISTPKGQEILEEFIQTNE